MEKFGVKQRRFQKKIKLFYILSQIPFILACFILFNAYDFSLLLLIIFLIYILSAGVYWQMHAIPEKKLSRRMVNWVVTPYVLCQLTSLISCIPLTVILLFYCNPVLILCMITFAFLIALYGYLKSFQITTKEIRIKIPGLSQYKVVHISDIHIGNMMSTQTLTRWIEKVNTLQPDIICITGDFITFGNAFLVEISYLIKNLNASYGVICCLGNHDYFISESQHLIQVIEENGGILLKNEVHTIKGSRGSLCIAGIDGVVDNFAKQKECLESTLKKIFPLTPHILLSHDPLIFPLAKYNKITLTLSGHTHAGQIANPFNPRKNLSSRRYHYSAGLYQEDDSYIYVHSGWGTAFLPFRLFTTPEIVIFNCI